MEDRREKRKRWIQRGRYAVEVEVEVVYPAEDPAEACLEADTLRFLETVAEKAERGDVEFLKSVGRVYETVEQ